MPNQQNIIYTFSLTEYVLKFYGMCAKWNSSWFILILHSYSRGKMTSRVISKLIICSLGWKFFSFEEICCNVVLTVVLLDPSLVLGMKVFAFLCCTRERNMANHSFGCTCTCLLSFPLSYGDVSGLCFGGDSFFSQMVLGFENIYIIQRKIFLYSTSRLHSDDWDTSLFQKSN